MVTERKPEQIIEGIPNQEFVPVFIEKSGISYKVGISLEGRDKYSRSLKATSGGYLTHEGNSRKERALYFFKDNGNAISFCGYYSRKLNSVLTVALSNDKFKSRLLLAAAENSHTHYTPMEAAKAALLIRGTLRTNGDYDLTLDDTVAYHTALYKAAVVKRETGKDVSLPQIRQDVGFSHRTSGKNRGVVTEFDEASLISIGLTQSQIRKEMKDMITNIKLSEISASAISQNIFKTMVDEEVGRGFFLGIKDKNVVVAILNKSCN